ncbi:MAG: HAD-IA family hydrolase, partial [Methylocella sp.]
MARFEGVQACVFDAYGTLFDVHAPLARLAGEIGPSAHDISQLWRRKQLEYTWLRSLMGVHADFWHVTGDA